VREAGGVEEASLGAWLRRQREMREIDLFEIAERTKISLRYLRAMEQDRFDVLPAPVFARGFLREYAKVVGLNPDEVVNFFLAAHRELRDPDPAAEQERAAAPVTPGPAPWSAGLAVALVGVAALAVVAFLAFWAESRRGGRGAEPPPGNLAAPPPAAAEPGPAAAPPGVAAPEVLAEALPDAPIEVTLDFVGECWVEAVVDGRDRISELHVEGESLQLDAAESVLLANIGNPAAVEVQVNGRPFTLGGQPGRPVKDLVIDLETAQRLGAAPPPPG
jgi:cytoskeletal protein RodZ